jgi:hypothetical protein
MIRFPLLMFVLALSINGRAATSLSVDTSAVRPGPIVVDRDESQLHVSWKDESSRAWRVDFSLDPTKPLIHAISVDDRTIVSDAKPIYRCATGTRKGGWDVFFDNPAGDPGGTRRFVAQFHPTSVSARSIGNRVRVTFDGLSMGIFAGTLRYDFYPGTALIQQVALLKTKETDVAYYYDAGLDFAADEDRSPGGNMESSISYYDPTSELRTITPAYGSERHTVAVHYRAIAARTGAGSLAIFPSPHRYFFARDYSTNLGYTWYSSWRGRVSLGIQQQPDDNTNIYPWINAPPGTEQEMGVFLLPNGGSAQTVLNQVKAFTHSDKFPHLPGYVTFAPHWHFAYTVQAMAKGASWVPPFKPELEAHGIDSVLIMDFHLDGHPGDLSPIRLQELKAYYAACRAQSDSHFLIIPAEEADILLGGHWGLVFPKPVLWYQDRKDGQPFKTDDPVYGTVYRVSTPDEMWKMVTAENGIVYETHPRTKGSTGYPDKILDTSYFRSPRYVGVGWKAMPSDLSSPRLGERAFKVLDDLNNLGLHKILIGEDDLFQISPTDELYSNLNANYLRMDHLPDFDQYNDLLASMAKGGGFISTGGVLLPDISVASEENSVRFTATVSSTFPLHFAEIVWGDGQQTRREIFPLDTSGAFENRRYEWSAKTPGWKWARLAVWDVSADGTFTNPTWNLHTR